MFKSMKARFVYTLIGCMGALAGITSLTILFFGSHIAIYCMMLMLLCNALVTWFSFFYARACATPSSSKDVVLHFCQERIICFLSDLFLVTMITEVFLKCFGVKGGMSQQALLDEAFLLIAMIGKYLMDLVAFGKELYRNYSVIRLENAYADGYVVCLNGVRTEAPIEFSMVHNSDVEFSISKASKTIYILAKENEYTEIMEEVCASKIVRSGIYYTLNCSFCCTFEEVAEKLKVPVLWLQARMPVIEKLLYTNDSILDVQVFEKEHTIDIIFCADAVCAICEGGDCDTCEIHDMMCDSDESRSVRKKKFKSISIKEVGDNDEEKESI